MNIQTGEIYGKQTSNQFVMYSVLKISKSKTPLENVVTLQNIDNPLSLFETTAQKLVRSGYIRVSQTPFFNTNLPKSKRKS